MGNESTERKLVPNPGIAYINTSKSGTKYIRLTLHVSELPAAKDGKIVLSGFFNRDKKTEKTPDIVFKTPIVVSKSAGSAGGTSANDDLPF